QQREWIGRSEGAEVEFTVHSSQFTAVSEQSPGTGPNTQHPTPNTQHPSIRVFTTRPDTLWGATFMVLAPEHPLVDALTAPEHRAEVQEYKERTQRETEIERLSTERTKTGVLIGAHAINPVNNAHIPIHI